MRSILIIGAGRSASSLIRYLLAKSESENLHLVVADLSLALAEKKTQKHPNATPIALNIFDTEERKAAMVSNLLVVLCADDSVKPVINTGTLH